MSKQQVTPSLLAPASLAGKKILITGGLGFIGSNIAHRCLELGAAVTIYDCLDPKSGGNLHNVDDIVNDVSIIINDIRNLEAICSAVINQDMLFSCAAFTSHPNSMREPLIDIDVNCKGVINILEGARRFNPNLRLVHVGTSTQIGKMVNPVIDETHPEFPVDIYSANKTASEKYVLIYANAYKIPACVVRLANVYGPRSNIRSPDFGFMNYFIGLALKDKELTIFGDGAQLRNITFVDDVVDALIMSALSEQTRGQALFACSQTQYSIREIALMIAEVIGGKVSFVEWPSDREAIEIGNAVIANDKITKLLGWQPRYNLKMGLAKTRDYFSPWLKNYL